MWICNRCQASNKDGHTQCMQCSAPRNARRFGAGTPVDAPSVQQVAGSQRRMQPPPAPQEQPVMAPPPPLRRQGTQPVSPPPAFKPAGGFVRLVGLLLSILLPLVVVLLAVLRLDTLKPLMEELFLGKAPAASSTLPQVVGAVTDATPAVTAASPSIFTVILGWVIYSASAFTAALLALVPGLSLWSLGHLGRNIRKR